jgi:hypothetical protein
MPRDGEAAAPPGVPSAGQFFFSAARPMILVPTFRRSALKRRNILSCGLRKVMGTANP